MARFNVIDSLTNLLGQIGTGKGKGSHTHYVDVPRSYGELKAAYDNAWLPAKIVDVPARDAIRQWRVWAEDAAAAEAEEDRLQLRRRTLQALTAARLYGGAALYVDTGTRTPDVPLRDTETIDRLVVLPAEQIRWPVRPVDMLQRADENFYVGTRRVHTSRLALFHGVPPVAGDWGFGQSVLKRAWEAVKTADSVPAAVAELIWEAKVDVYKIKDFMVNLSDPGYEQKILNRLRLANTGKSLVNGLLLDAEEDYEQKQINFGELSQLIMTAYQVAAGAADIPVTRLLGQSAAGLNSAGDNEVRDYYDSIRAIQELQIEAALSRIDQHIARKTGQAVDYQWRSLWQLSPAEHANTLKTTADAVQSLQNSELIPNDVLYNPVIQQLAEVLPGIDASAEEFAEGIDDI